MGESGCNLEPRLPLGVSEVSIANTQLSSNQPHRMWERLRDRLHLQPLSGACGGRRRLNKWMCHKSWVEKVWQMNRWLQCMKLAARAPLVDIVRWGAREGCGGKWSVSEHLLLSTETSSRVPGTSGQLEIPCLELCFWSCADNNHLCLFYLSSGSC